MFVKIHDKNYGELLLPNSLFRFMSETPGRIKWACRPIGADNEYIYAKYLGIFKDELERLKSKGVILARERYSNPQLFTRLKILKFKAVMFLTIEIYS
jgi:hypothetical protein